MLLRYPNARLFLLDLLRREHLSGGQALAAGACRYELVPAQAVSDILLTSSDGDCICLETAAVIVQKHLALRPSAGTASQLNPATVFAEIEKQIEKNADLAALAGPCNLHAPVLFDIMLQQLSRYL